jgi:hypothetical protein
LLRVLLKTFKFSRYSCTKGGFTCNTNGKGAKYSQVMHEDVKSIRLNNLAQSITLLTHFVGAGTPNILTEIFRAFTQFLLIRIRIT